MAPQYSLATNKELWALVRYRQGDQDPCAAEAFAELESRHFGPVVAKLAARRAVTPEDSTQTAFVALWKDRVSEPSESVRGWLNVTAWRFDLDERRRRLCAGLDQALPDFGDEGSDPLLELPAPVPNEEPAIERSDWTLQEWAAGLREMFTRAQLSDKEVEHFLLRSCLRFKSANVCQYYAFVYHPWTSGAEQAAWYRLKNKVKHLIQH